MKETYLGNGRYLIGVKAGEDIPGGDDPVEHYRFLQETLATAALALAYPEGIVPSHYRAIQSKEDAEARLDTAVAEVEWLKDGKEPTEGEKPEIGLTIYE